MKVMINGATFGSNFGDYLFAQMFQDRISELIGKENVYFYFSRYTMSEYYAEHLDNRKKCELKDIDALVYMSGGYFCGNDTNWKDTVRRYLRYYLLGDRCIMKKIPYAIIGADVSIPKSRFMRAVQKRILKKAKLITVRNEESMECLKEMGIEGAICTTDSAFAIERSMFESKSVPKEIAEHEKKLLLFHVYPGKYRNGQVTERLIPVINAFTDSHPEYTVVVAADQTADGMSEEMERIASILTGETLIYNYDDPIALCALIDRVNTVVTPKLHVGILGARLGKSVISFCNHAEKIVRLYAHLGEAGRTLPLSELTLEKGVEMLEKYHATPISLPEEITEKSRSNFTMLDEFIKNTDGAPKNETADK